MSAKEEFVEVTIKIPKKLMDMLEAENYFGYTKDGFFVAAIKSITGCLWSVMHYEKELKLRKKYGEDSITYELPEGLVAL